MAGNSNSGRKRKPAAIRKAEGKRGHRPIPDEVEARGSPRLPVHLTPAERLIWARVMETVPKGVLAGCDEYLLEGFVISVATYHEADQLIKRSSLLVRNTEGNPTANPLLRIRSRALAEMRSCAIELGLSPSSRTRLTKEPSADENDPMEWLLGREDDPASAWARLPKQ